MNRKSLVQILITLAVVVIYLVLVLKGKANVEGFVVIATYTIKKFLDIAEKEGEAK